MKNTDTNYLNIYILEYKSDSLKSPLYLVWYTDENGTDKLLTSLSSKIICFSKINKELIKSYFDWVDKPLNFAENTLLYDIDIINENISQEILDDKIIESFTDFINLFGDFTYQDDKNSHLKTYIEDESIYYLWQYYNKYIFWPKFNNTEIYKPPLDINYKQLQNSFNKLTSIFEKHLEIISTL